MKLQVVDRFLILTLALLSFFSETARAVPRCDTELGAPAQTSAVNPIIPSSVKDFLRQHNDRAAEREMSYFWSLDEAQKKIAQSLEKGEVDSLRAPLLLLKFCFGDFFRSFRYQVAIYKAVVRFTNGEISSPLEVSEFVRKIEFLTMDMEKAELFGSLLAEELRSTLQELTQVQSLKKPEEFGIPAELTLYSVSVWRDNWMKLSRDPQLFSSTAMIPLLLEAPDLAQKMAKIRLTNIKESKVRTALTTWKPPQVLNEKRSLQIKDALNRLTLGGLYRSASWSKPETFIYRTFSIFLHVFETRHFNNTVSSANFTSFLAQPEFIKSSKKKYLGKATSGVATDFNSLASQKLQNGQQVMALTLLALDRIFVNRTAQRSFAYVASRALLALSRMTPEQDLTPAEKKDFFATLEIFESSLSHVEKYFSANGFSLNDLWLSKNSDLKMVEESNQAILANWNQTIQELKAKFAAQGRK